MALQEEDVPLSLSSGSASPGASKPSFSFIDPADLLKPLPPRDHFVAPLLPAGSIVVVGGYGSSAKTWFALSLVLSIAQGTPWLGRFKTTKASAAFFDYETGEYESRRRFQALSAGLGTSGTPDVAVCVHPTYSLSSPEVVPALGEVLEERRVAVFDSLRAATPGIDENDSSVRRHIDDLRRVRGFDKGCIVLLAHARKGGTGDVREQLRGSGAIFDAADLVFFLKAEDNLTFAVHQTKNRFGATTPSFKFRLENVKANGVRLVEAVSAVPTASVGPKNVDAVRSAIAAHPGISARALRAHVGGRGTGVDAAAQFLVETGIVEKDSRGGYQLGVGSGGAES